MNLRHGPIRDVLETVILALVVFLVVQGAVQNFQVEGSSMQPTLTNSDFVLVNKLAYQQVDLGPFDFLIPGRSNGDYLFGAPQRGDVIVFAEPSGQPRDFVKRVVGLPGDSVEIRDGLVFVNDVAIEESEYTSAPPVSTNARLIVPPNHFYVLGDNRNASQDSRAIGPIHRRLLIGKVIFRWFPLDRIGTAGSRDLITVNGAEVR